MSLNRTSRRPESTEKLLTQEQVAVILNVSCRALQEWRMRNYGPQFLRLGYRTVRYRAEDVEQWRRKQKAA